jgi:hypothetical protein
VKLTVSDGVNSRLITKKDFINVHVCAGTTILTVKPKLSIYPNPAKSLIRVKFSEPLGEGSKFYIYDLVGRKVMEKNLNKGTIESGISVDVSSLHKGLYIIKLISGIINVSSKVVIE